MTRLPCQATSPAELRPALLLHLLNRCNLSCRHCYIGASPRCDTELPLDLALNTLREGEALHLGVVYLSGGEPFLYRGLRQVLSVAAGLRGVEVRVATNGTLIGRREAEDLRLSGARAQVSIDGPETYHDRFRGMSGAFRKTTRGISHLVSAGVPVTVVTTLCRANKDCLPWLAEWASDLGVGSLSVQPLLALGRGSEIGGERLSRDQLCCLYFRMSDLGYRYKGRGLSLSLAHRTRQFLLAHPCAAYVCNGARCHRGVKREIKKIVVREDGTVLPEIPTLDRRFAMGNLREGPLSEILARYLDDGYERFARLCRSTFREVVPTWTSPLVPWDEIVSERSTKMDGEEVEHPLREPAADGTFVQFN